MRLSEVAMLNTQSHRNIETEPNSLQSTETTLWGPNRPLCGSELQLLGLWKLEDSFEQNIETGEVIRSRGSIPQGSLTYLNGRNMSVQVMNDGRLPLDCVDRDACHGELAKAAFFGYTAYFGWFEVDEEERAVIHHMEGSLIPNEVGSSRKRFFSVTGDRLTLVTPPFVTDGRRLVRWIVWVRGASIDQTTRRAHNG